jgi:hypothetical protein
MSRLREFFAPYWHSIQTTLFPWLEEELGPLTDKQQQLVQTLEIIRVEQHLAQHFSVPGRPAKDRAAIARAFVAKATSGAGSVVRASSALRSCVKRDRKLNDPVGICVGPENVAFTDPGGSPGGHPRWQFSDGADDCRAVAADILHDPAMVSLFMSLIRAPRCALRTRTDLALENLALRQQLANLRRTSSRPRLRMVDHAFWLALSRLWSRWADALVIVKPDTVARWHRTGFRLFWKWKSRPRSPAQNEVSPETKARIREMAKANPSWGAPRTLALGMAGHCIAGRLSAQKVAGSVS